MKCLMLCFALCFTAAVASAQDFSGYRAGNFTGVNGAFFNPASIADSRYRFDFNLFSVSGYVGNNQASFNLKDIVRSFDADSLQQQLIGKNAGPFSSLVSADIHGPSFMFNTGRKMAFALTTRGRVVTNITDLDGKLANKLTEDLENEDATLPYTIASANNMRVNVNAWSEIGLTIARVLRDSGAHFFKAGATLKYLAGAGNAYVNVDRLNGTLNENAAGDAYLTNTTGRIALGFGGINVSDIEAGDITRMESSGFGADFGFVYEYRPDGEGHELGETSTLRRDVNKYKFKVGVALTDVGGFKYKRDMARSGGYTLDITGTDTLYLSELENTEVNGYKEFFNKYPQYFTPDNSNNAETYKVGLPTALHLNVDYHLHRGFYVDLVAQIALSNSNNKPYNSSYYSGITLTPRYEGRKLGLYVPLTYNGLTKFNAGAALRLGPLFVGSGSVLTALLGNSKQADAYVGLRFGILQRKAGKELRKTESKQERKARRLEKAAGTMPEPPQQNR